jgi:hypothetical protein
MNKFFYDLYINMNHNGSSVAMRSFQGELSHLLSILPIITSPAVNIRIMSILYFITIFHLRRYIRYFSIAKEISIKQKNYLWLNLVDYYIILLAQEKTNLTIPLSIISGIISFFFIFEYHGYKTKFSDNLPVDLFMVSFLLISLYFSNNKNLQFFCIRDLVYHILEFKIYY